MITLYQILSKELKQIWPNIKAASEHDEGHYLTDRLGYFYVYHFEDRNELAFDEIQSLNLQACKILLNLSFQSEACYLSYMRIALLEANEISQVDAKLVAVLYFERLEFLIYQLLSLVVGREALFN